MGGFKGHCRVWTHGRTEGTAGTAPSCVCSLQFLCVKFAAASSSALLVAAAFLRAPGLQGQRPRLRDPGPWRPPLGPGGVGPTRGPLPPPTPLPQPMRPHHVLRHHRPLHPPPHHHQEQAPGKKTLQKYRQTGALKRVGLGVWDMRRHGESARPCERPPPNRTKVLLRAPDFHSQDPDRRKQMAQIAYYFRTKCPSDPFFQLIQL